MSAPFEVSTDASDTGIGYILSNVIVHSVRDGQFTPQEFQEYKRADPVLGVVLHALKTRGFNMPTQDNVLRQWQKKRKFLIVGKEDGLLRIRYNIGKRIVNQLVVPIAFHHNRKNRGRK